MENKINQAPPSRIENFLQQITDKLDEQVWYQQLKSQWNSLDTERKKQVKLVTSIGSTILVIGGMIAAHLSLSGLKQELTDKNDIIHQITSATDELKRLREQSARPTSQDNPATPWSAFLEGLVTTTGIDRASLTLSAEKPGQSSDQSKESLFDIQLKKISITQVVRLAFAIETAARPIKLRNLSIDTHADPEGYLDASLSVSGFMVKSEDKK